MPSLADFIAEHGITSTWKHVAGPRPSKEWPVGTHHYSVTMRRAMTMEDGGGGLMTVLYHMGAALTNPPTTEEVLETLAVDSSSYENAKDAEDWMSEYGETNVARGWRMYEAVEAQAQKLLEFLGEDLYKELLWETERE